MYYKTALYFFKTTMNSYSYGMFIITTAHMCIGRKSRKGNNKLETTWSLSCKHVALITVYNSQSKYVYGEPRLKLERVV